MVDVGITLRVESLANTPGDIGQVLDVLQRELLRVLLDQEEAVAAPGDVAGDAAEAWHFDGHVLLLAPARHVGDGYLPVGGKRSAHHADRRVDAMLARLDATEVRERDHQADRAVAAHADRADDV